MSHLSAPGKQQVEPGITHRLMLFIVGGAPKSIEALQNLRNLCNAELQGRHTLQVVNVLEEYETALAYRVLVTPCLVMLEPAPRVMIAGTLQDTEQVRTALRLNREVVHVSS